MPAFSDLSAIDPSAMRWIRIAPDRNAFELRAGDAIVAELSWPSSAGSLAHVGTSRGTWTLKRGGFLQPHVTVRDAEGREVARLQAHLTGGIVEIGGGLRYRLRRAGILVPSWQVFGPTGPALVHLEPVSERRHLEGGLVQVEEGFLRSPDLGLLVVLAWYFIVLAWFEDEAMNATVAAMAAING